MGWSEITGIDELDGFAGVWVTEQVAVGGRVEMARRWAVKVFEGAAACVDQALHELASTDLGADALQCHQIDAPRPWRSYIRSRS